METQKCSFGPFKDQSTIKITWYWDHLKISLLLRSPDIETMHSTIKITWYWDHAFYYLDHLILRPCILLLRSPDIETMHSTIKITWYWDHAFLY